MTATKQTIIDSTDANNVYYGSADLGRATTDNKWSIYRKNTNGSVVTNAYPIGLAGSPSEKENFIWDERAQYNYSLVDDVTAPTLSTVTIASNNTTTTLAKVGDEVTLTIVASEVIETPVVTIGAGLATVTLGADEKNYTATRAMTSDDVNGTVTFSIAFEDIASRPGTTVTALTGGSAVTFDKTVPTLASVTDTNVTTLNVVLSELAITGTITKANAGGFVVYETGTPATTYAVASIAPGVDNTHVVLTVADMTASAVPGVTVTYVAGGNGTVTDLAGNALATNATGVVTGAF